VDGAEGRGVGRRAASLYYAHPLDRTSTPFAITILVVGLRTFVVRSPPDPHDHPVADPGGPSGRSAAVRGTWAGSRLDQRIAAAAVAFTFAVNLLRGWPVLSMVATLLIAAGLYVRWNRTGWPTGIEDVEAQAEAT
jgi:hypothetical protein